MLCCLVVCMAMRMCERGQWVRTHSHRYNNDLKSKGLIRIWLHPQYTSHSFSTTGFEHLLFIPFWVRLYMKQRGTLICRRFFNLFHHTHAHIHRVVIRTHTQHRTKGGNMLLRSETLALQYGFKVNMPSLLSVFRLVQNQCVWHTESRFTQPTIHFQDAHHHKTLHCCHISVQNTEVSPGCT